MPTVDQLNLGADQLGEFHRVVMKTMRPNWECYITDVVAKPEDPETVEVMVYGSNGTTLMVILNDKGWVAKEFYCTMEGEFLECV